MKKVWQIISIVVVIALALGMTAFAENSARAVCTIGKVVDAKVGEIISVPVYLETSAEADSIALDLFEYDITVLEFVGFSNNEAIDEKALFKTWSESPMMVLIGLEESMTFEGDNELLCDLQFRVVNEGETNISAMLIIKDNANEFATAVEAGSVKTVGSQASDIEIDEVREAARDARKQDVIALKIDASTAYIFGKTAAIDPDNSKVVPYLKNDRTLVPLRFVSETLGAEVKWEEGWNYCYVVKGDKEIKITFNSADIEVNGEVVAYDAPVEVVENRTMVPIRFISEELGYDVKWNQPNQLVIITPADNPWIEDRQAETDVLEGILVTYLFNGIF